MNYEYGEPYLEITFHDDRVVRIKKSAITDMREEKVKENDDTAEHCSVSILDNSILWSWVLYG